MASRSKFRLNSRTVQEYLDGRYGVQGVLDAEAAKVLDRARGLAPVDTGEYRASLHVVTGHPHDRMAKRVTSSAPHGLVVEARDGVLAKALG